MRCKNCLRILGHPSKKSRVSQVCGECRKHLITVKNSLSYKTSNKCFAYGSNLDLIQMNRRCPSSKIISKGSLSDYRLDFNRYSSGWGGGVADVIPVKGSEVWGLVFELSDTDMDSLDFYEGCYKDRPSLYERSKVVINTPKGPIPDVWLYTVVEKQKFEAPTAKYLGIIKMAAARWNFPNVYQRILEQTKISGGMV
tara:strand:- start:33 stop:623 length:591 start_codon:yes stop_codon:yes gene_type:complete